MTTENDWDRILTELLKENENIEIQKIRMEQEDIRIPSELDKKIRSQIQRGSAPYKEFRQQKHLLKVASILLLFTLLGTGLFLVTPKAVAFVEKIIVQEYPDHNIYRFGTKYVEVHKGDYALGYIPEGFELVEEVDVINTHREIYSSEDGRAFVFTYKNADTGSILEDTEELIHEDFELNGMKGKLIYAKEGELPYSSIFVLDGDVFVEVFAHLEKEEVIKSLESVFENR